MADKIRIELDDQTKSGVQSVNSGLDSMAAHSDNATKEFDQLNDEMSSRAAEQQAEFMRNLGSQFKATSSAANDARVSIKHTNDEVKNTGDAAGKSAFSMSGLAKAGLGLFAIKEAAQKVGMLLTAMAANGSKGAQDLQSSFSKFIKLMLDFASNPIISTALKLVGDGIGVINYGLEQTNKLLQKSPDYFAIGGASAAEYFGIVRKGTTEATIELQKTQKAQLEHAKTMDAIRGKQFEYTRILGELEAKRIAEQKVAFISETTDLNALLKLRDQQISRIQKLFREGQANSQVFQEAIELRDNILARMVTVEAEREKKALEEIAGINKKIDEDRLNAERQMQEDLQREEEAAWEQKRAWVKFYSDERFRTEKEAADQRLKLAEEEEQRRREILSKNAENQKGNVQAIVGGLTPQQIARQIAAQRQREAEAQFRKERGDDIWKADWSGDKDAMRKLKREFDQAGDRARTQGLRDVFAGKVGQQEIIAAQEALTNGVINQAQASGKLSKEQVEGLREATNVLTRQAGDIAQLQDDAAQSRKQLALLLGRGPNAQNRAQRAGVP